MSALIAQQTPGHRITGPDFMALAVFSSISLLAVYVIAHRRLCAALVAGSLKRTPSRKAP